MALDSNDIAMLHSMGMSPYEQFKVGHMQSKRASGTAIAGLGVGIGAAVLAIGGAAWAGSRAQNAKDVAVAKNDGLRDLVISNTNNTNATLDRIVRALERETDARVNGDINVSTTITDTLSGQQSGQLSASQVATNEATAQIVAGVMTGKYSESPQKVELLTPAQPFQCGCGCNG